MAFEHKHIPACPRDARAIVRERGLKHQSSFEATCEQWSAFGVEAGAVASGAAAATGTAGAPGLVPSKTSHHEKTNHHAGDCFDVTFSKPDQAIKRIKRLKRGVWASGHLHGIADHGFRPPQCHFVTLTYANANQWHPDHISAATQRFRNYCKRKGVECRYLWVAEIQPKRLERTGDAVVHYHLLAWLPRGVRMPKWDLPTTSSGRTVRSMWRHGMTNTQAAKSGVGYLMKYLSKLGELTVFPDGLRLYGVGGLNQQARAVRFWYNLPEWAKNEYGVGDLKRMGSLLVVVETGEVLPPMYHVQHIPNGIRLTLLRERPPRLHDGAYSTWSKTGNVSKR